MNYKYYHKHCFARFMINVQNDCLKPQYISWHICELSV
jgi:hypothetical protein